MELISESDKIQDYLEESKMVDFSNPLVKQVASSLFNASQTEIEKTKIAFLFMRDQINHVWDIQSRRVTCKASEVLRFKEGICYAKANLFAALLRCQGIPTGFCYQRLMLFDTFEKGYSLHALNAVYLQTLDKWIRLDARGNNDSVDAQFSLDEERLAFPVQKQFDEIDYPTIYVRPNQQTLDVLKHHSDMLEIYQNYLPEKL
ncbi:transglutaminase family protein [Gracilibacillus caseinilyticus]|uniref:Transglutaminase family protein n=1 Tax=Gracilibacillus caseinilyticus TaxID=2932256 RepID=A0ABY4EW86_9BACI|nr:transglutaminase family protein [Gracilibacillus caseinilyticus]UOQ48544.1 transglutaminase family protein [Gracilibacillus caseinilyticus]